MKSLSFQILSSILRATMSSRSHSQARRERGDGGNRQQQESTARGGRGRRRGGTTPTTRPVPSRSSYASVTRRSARLSQAQGSPSAIPVVSSVNTVSMSTAVVATAPTIVAAPTAPQLQGSWAEHTATKGSVQSGQARREASCQIFPSLVSSAKKPCAASPSPVQQDHKAPSASQQPNATSQEKPAQAGATGQETAREETISSADRECYKELLALLQL